MNAVRFHVVIGEDRVLTVPQGIEFPPGPVEVIVLHPNENIRPPDLPVGETVSQRLVRRARELNLR